MSASWLTSVEQVPIAADDASLRRTLLTCDGAGVKVKEAALAELLRRLTLAMIRSVEATHFRTVDDTGANPHAMIIWNTLRRETGLSQISKDDLPAWAFVQYVKPPASKLA